MSTQYRKEWTSPTTGWRFRLDIVPYDATLSSTRVMLSGAESTAIEIGAIESKFDSLPYGLKSPDQMTINLVYSKLPADLKTKLLNKVQFLYAPVVGWQKNTFLYFSDRGTGGVTWSLEFCGTPAKIAGTSYTKEAGAYTTSIELVDAMYDALVGMPMSKIESNAWAGNYHTVLYDVGFPSAVRSDAYHTARVEDTGWSTGFFVESWASIFNKIRTNITAELIRQTCRTTNISAAATQQAADATGNMPALIGNVVEFYECTTTYPRYIGNALTTSTAKLVTRVIEKDTAATVGGMVSTRDEVSWARYETAWDWYKDLCESFGAKVAYRPVYNAGGGNPYISYVWSVGNVKGWFDFTQTASLDDSLEYPEFTETEDAIAKAETRTEMFSDNNVTQWVVNSGVMRADKQFTSQMYLHNLPTTMDTIRGGDSDQAAFASIGLFQTNRIVYEANGQCFLAHPTLKIYTSPSNSTLYTATDPDSAVDLGTEPPTYAFDQATTDRYNLWVNAVQSYGGLPYAVAQHVTTTFGNDSLASFDATFRIADYPKLTLPSGVNTNAIGMVVDLSSSSVASELTHFAWSTAIISGVQCDLQAGSAVVSFTMVP
jgi:hypothetical protein